MYANELKHHMHGQVYRHIGTGSKIDRAQNSKHRVCNFVDRRIFKLGFQHEDISRSMSTILVISDSNYYA